MQKLLTHIVCEGEVLTADLTPIFGQNTYQWLKRLEADRKIIKLGRGKYASADIPFSSDGSGAS